MMPAMPEAESFLAAAAAIVGAQQLLTGCEAMAPYLADWRGHYRGAAIAVARPAATAEVAALVALCAKHGVPVVPQGGNTGLAGAATPDASGRALVLCLGRMRRILEISAVAGTAAVEAGCVLADLHAAAEAAGLVFPLSLGSEGSCQIGGTIATNAGGTAVLRHGPMRELVLGLEVVLADGTVCDWMSPLRKNAAGYDLKQLFIGAEGTLGVITAAVVKLFPRPAETATAMAAVADGRAALALLERARRRLGDRLASFEVINRAQVAVVRREMPALRLPIGAAHPWQVLVELTDTLSGTGLRGALESMLAAALEDGVVLDAAIAESAVQAEAMWRLRHSVSEANRRAGINVSHDTAVPVDRQADFIAGIEARLAARWPDTELLMVGHLGDGNIHVILLLDPRHYADPLRQRAMAGEINAIVDAVTLSLGGTVSAEHGIGQSHLGRLLAARGTADIALMRRLKAALDPHGLLNPGKIFALHPADGVAGP